MKVEWGGRGFGTVSSFLSSTISGYTPYTLLDNKYFVSD